MALQAAYAQFLAAPQSSALSENASLHYITTTTSHHGPTDIIKHLGTLRNQVRKKKEQVLHVVESQNAIAAETETTLEFVSSGGVYLPGLDDNFLTDRTVVLPIVHIVSFDNNGKISQIRQSWDQGSLLKQLDVIGRTGRNWPIRDSKDQLKLIVNSLGAAPGAVKRPSESESTSRSRGNSTNVLRDPHASLALFAPREETEKIPEAVVSPYAGSRPRQRDFVDILGDNPDGTHSPAHVVSPYTGSRPRQRDFAEIFGDEPVNVDVGSPSNGRERSESPSKAIAPKIGAGKNYQPSRLFDRDDGDESGPNTPDKNQSPQKFVRPHSTKYKHFEFADGTEPQDAPQAGFDYDSVPKTKHDSTWSFADFVTPQKPLASRPIHRAQDVRHWGNENDEVAETPAKKAVQAKPRRDAETQIEFRDDGLPSKDKRPAGRPRGAGLNDGLGLYQNNLYNEDGSTPAPGPEARPLGNITNLKDRRKDFDTQFTMTDESPHHQAKDSASAPQANQENRAAAPAQAKVSEDRMKAVRMMESNWSAYDESPQAHKENSNPSGKKSGDERGITIAGDGMGGKKGAGRGWGIGDESDEEQNQRAIPGKKQGQKSSSFWEF